MAPHPLIQKLCSRGPVLTDGAWGTQLQARGLVPGDVPDLWNISHPGDVAAVAAAYVDAGSDIILTNTFGANRVRLAESDCAGQIKEINRDGVALSRAAAGERALVFASIGPSGKMLAGGDISEEVLRATYEEQVECLTGADGLVVETMQDLDEAMIATRAAKASGLPVVASMVFDSGKERDRTMMGTTPEQAAAGLLEAGADVVGANCGQGISGFVAICRRLKAAAGGRPVWIKANAGLPKLRDGKPIYDTTPEEFGSFVPQLLEAGAGFIGGCCGTSPDFIREIHRLLRRMR